MVTLSGHVGSYAEKLAAERVVQRVKGVRAIVQNLEVRLPSDRKTDDEDIALRALNVISWDTTLPADEIKVHVQKGWITLTGEVDWQFQRQGAEHAVRRLTGVLGVYNWITVKPRVEVRDIKYRIENALMRNAQLEAGQIQVDVSGSHVKLQGNVRALARTQPRRTGRLGCSGRHIGRGPFGCLVGVTCGAARNARATAPFEFGGAPSSRTDMRSANGVRRSSPMFADFGG